MKSSKSLYTILLVVVVVLLVGLVGALEKESLEVEQRQYCQMHELWIKSGGELGWPDYNKNYAEVCK